MANDPEIVNVAWLCNLVGCSTATINRYIEEGKIKRPFKLGRDRLWIKSELIEHLIAQSKTDDEPTPHD